MMPVPELTLIADLIGAKDEVEALLNKQGMDIHKKRHKMQKRIDLKKEKKYEADKR